MFLSGTFGISPPMRPQWSTFGQFWEHFGNTASIFKMFPVFQFPWHILAVFPKCSQNCPKVAHCGCIDRYIPNVPLRNISDAQFWFILNFTDWEHCDHITGNTAKYTVNEPLGNITGTFFGKIQGFPTDYLIRSLWSHDLGYCQYTEHFLWISHSGISQVLSLGKFRMYPWIT